MAEREAGDVVAAYEFTGMRRLVDVGGGRGVLLSAILRAAPGLCGLLMDRPAAIPEARRRLDADGLGDRAECLARRLLRRCRPARTPYPLS